MENNCSAKWRKIVSAALLGVTALLNLLFGLISFILGQQYTQGNKDSVYKFFGGLRIADLAYGILLILIAALAVYTVLGIKKNTEKAPKLFLLTYIANILIGIAYIIVVKIIIANHIPLSFTFSVLSIIFSAVITLADIAYNNREKIANGITSAIEKAKAKREAKKAAKAEAAARAAEEAARAAEEAARAAEEAAKTEEAAEAEEADTETEEETSEETEATDELSE